MITCPKCGKQLADGARFCKFCGSQVPQTNVQNPVQNNAQIPAREIQVTAPAPEKKKSSKGIVIAIVAIVIIVAIVLGIIFLPDLLGKKKDEDLTDKEKLTQLLEESTTKPIIEFVYDDYDSDGTYEAYAVVGETDEEDEKHPEFYDADIYFVNHKKAQKIKEDVSGQVNGTMKVDDKKYISIEVYNDGTDEGKSFIYTADGTKSVEPEISGKYSKVYKKSGKIVGIDKNGNEVEVDFSLVDSSSVEKEETSAENNEIEDDRITDEEPFINDDTTSSGISAEVGDHITFGAYEQDNDTTNGAEAIEWIVIDKQDGKILVISKYALDWQSYHDEWGSVTWENCALRSWLNNEFINSAFTSEEKTMIPTMTVTAEDNLEYGIDAGNDTQDKVFLLSISEAKNLTAGIQRCEITEYVRSQSESIEEDLYGRCLWWLRSPGDKENSVAIVYYDGFVYEAGYLTGRDSPVVRPAMWINL